MTDEQRDVLRCAARWIWHGSQPASSPNGEKFRYWEQRMTRAAVRMLNAECGNTRVTREALARMLARIDSQPPEVKP